jgi:CDP-Glycerol:Poly(glycerophosphate) glycerophosphotransferase
VDVLVMNHSFEQDIAALRGASPDWRWRVISLEYFYREAMRIFEPGVTDGLAGYTRPEYAEARARYRERLAELLEDLWLEERFDVFIAPSDSFFYLREAVHGCRRLGVPFLVVQKETTIAPWNMEKGSRELREHAPLVADHMTVCSERHRDYWLRAGAHPDAMTVTGQPRFDFYADNRRVELRYGEEGPIILFFTYLPDFYHPVMVTSEGEGVWSDLLHRTEQGLWQLAQEGYRVLVKPHPLQPFRFETRRIKNEVGSLFGSNVFAIEPTTDVRTLIAGSDIAVGFQSTVMFEAMAAGLPLVYTFWDPEAQRLAETMVPFHEWGDLLEVVEHADDFIDRVRRAPAAPWGSDLWHARRELAESHLGSLDGGASARAIHAIATHVSAFRSSRGELAVGRPRRTRPSLRLRRYRARERAIRTASRLRHALGV